MIFVVMVLSYSQAANVVWNTVSLSNNGEWGGVTYYSLSTPYLMFVAEQGSNGLLCKADTVPYMEFRCAIKTGTAGMLVDGKSMASEPYFYYSEFETAQSEVAYSNYDIFIDYGESVLLAYETSYYYAPEKHYYGWIELSVNEDGTLRLIQSAYDQDGDGIMIQRQTATPEPSSALLLLVGVGLLALQRRRVAR